MTWQPQKLRDFFRYYDPNNANHTKAVDKLQEAAASVMDDSQDWVKIYRTKETPKQDDKYIAQAAEIIKEFEGFVSYPYMCPAGVWTIGYGSTDYPDGTPVRFSDPEVSEETATEYLQFYVKNRIVATLSKTIPLWDSFNNNQKASVISFAYNLGEYFYGAPGFNSITKSLSSPMYWATVPDSLMLYVNPGSPFEGGLRRRRSAEGELWMGKGPYAG